eukprot:1871893-Prymnesium_polylepis.1
MPSRPAGRVEGAVGAASCSVPRGVRGSARRRSAVLAPRGFAEVMGEARSPGKGSSSSSDSSASTIWSGWANLSGRYRAASHAAWPTWPSTSPCATRPSLTSGMRFGEACGRYALPVRVCPPAITRPRASRPFNACGYAAARAVRDRPC